MIWYREPNALNNRPSYKAGTARADYRIVPAHYPIGNRVFRGFDVYAKAIESSTWGHSRAYSTLREAKTAAESIESLLRKDWIPPTVCAEFRTWLAEVGQSSERTNEQVYALWHEYSETCRAGDQSPVKSEFLEWYKGQLAGKVA